MSPMIGIVLLVILTVLLAATVALLAAGFTDRTTEPTDVLLSDRCPGFQAVEFDPGDLGDFRAAIQENHCALWLEQGQWETDGEGAITRWVDQGPNEFDAVADSESQRPAVVTDEDLGVEVLAFEATVTDQHDENGTDGQYLTLQRDVRSLDVDPDSGIVVVALLAVETFDRGGAWTIGEAGADGREFSMRTCSDRVVDGCQTDEPEGEWRAQHWGSEDVDFSSGTNSTAEWIVLTHAYDGESVAIRVNGEAVATEPVALDLSEDRDVQLGRWERTPGDPHWYFTGEMAELVIVDEALETADVELIEVHLAERFGVALDGPVD